MERGKSRVGEGSTVFGGGTDTGLSGAEASGLTGEHSSHGRIPEVVFCRAALFITVVASGMWLCKLI